MKWLFILLSFFGAVNANGSVRYVIDHNREYPVVVAEVDPDGTALATYTYGADPWPLHRRDELTGAIHYYHYDSRGSLYTITDDSGSVLARYEYDAFGNPTFEPAPQAAALKPFYAGHALDTETGEYYARSRYYDPKLGRFTQMDSWDGVDGHPATKHKYTYAHNDPVNATDPTGRSTALELNAANTIGAALLVAATSTYNINANRSASPGNDGLLATEFLQLATAVRNGLNEIIYFNTKHTNKVIQGLLADAEEHAAKIGGTPPEDPNQNHWKKEVRAFLQRAKNLADKRLKGNTRVATLERIDKIASKAGVTLK
jgi:RHS repeat-associated protein